MTGNGVETRAGSDFYTSGMDGRADVTPETPIIGAFQSQRSELAEVLADLPNYLSTEELKKAETSFIVGERIRQSLGLKTLALLLDLENPQVNQVLGIDEIPPGFDLARDWLEPTRKYHFETTIEGSDGSQIEIAGVRIQANVVDRDEQAREMGCVTPVGGGTRVKFVPAERVDKTWRIRDKGEQLASLVDEASALAAAMVPKNTGLVFQKHLINVLDTINRKDLILQAKRIFIGGGAKADIIIAHPEVLEGEQQVELATKALFALGFHLGKQGVIGPFIDRLAGDRGTSAIYRERPIIEWIVDGYLAALQEKAKDTGETVDRNLALATVTGKLEAGLEARADATGLSTWESLKAYAEAKGIDLSGKTVFFRGCGSAACRAIVEAAKAGMKVQAIATSKALITCENGFTPDDARELFDVSVNQKESIGKWARQQPQKRKIRVYAEPNIKDRRARASLMAKIVQEYWKEEKPDVIFESATQMTINQKSAWDVPEGAIIVEGANGVTNPMAATILKYRVKIRKEKPIERIPGINCNAGGVFTSWFEWAQSVLGVRFPTAIIEKENARLMKQNMEATLRLQAIALEDGLSFTQEEIFYAYAIAQGLKTRQEVSQLKGTKKKTVLF